MLTVPLSRSIIKSRTKLSSVLAQHAKRSQQFLTSTKPACTSSTGNSYFHTQNVPEPLPAVAYDYYDDNDDDSEDGEKMELYTQGGGSSSHDITAMAGMAGDLTFIKSTKPSVSSPNTPNYNIRHRKLSGGGGGGSSGGPPSNGGGGSGSGGNVYHKCPKCGMSVTFKHGDYEENTFYCATCSGWFLVKNSEKETSFPFTYDEFDKGTSISATNNSNSGGSGSASKQRKNVRPQILMSHVS